MRERLESLRRLAARNLAIGSALALPLVASAQTDPWADALADATDKVTTYGGGLVVLAVVGVGFMIAVKYVKKLTRAA